MVNKYGWTDIMQGIRAEIRNVVSARCFRKQQGCEKTIRMYEAYIESLKMLQAEFELYAPLHTAREYAKMQGFTLSDPPRWTDYVTQSDKEAYRMRQQVLSDRRKPVKLLFPDEDRLPYGSRNREIQRKRRANLRKQLHEEDYNNAGRLREEAELNPEATFATFRAQQLIAAWGYLKHLDENPDKRVPMNWLELLPPEDRPSPADTEVRTIAYIPQPSQRTVVEPDPDAPILFRGRPMGIKDSKPRVRRKMTEAQKAESLSKRHARAEYKAFVKAKYGEDI